LALLLAPAAALAELPAEAFFQPFLTHVSLSPDGSQLAAVVARGEKETIIVRGTRDSKLLPVSRNEQPGWRVSDLRWASSERLIFELEAYAGGFQRSQLWAVNRDGARKEGLGDFVAQPHAGVISTLREKPDRVLVSHSGKAFELDILHGHTGAPVADHEGVQRWYADPLGKVRAGASAPFARGKRQFYARQKGSGPFELVSAFAPGVEAGLTFAAFDERQAMVFVHREDPADRRTLHRYDLQGAKLGETVFAHPEVDVGPVVLDFAGRAVGVDYIVDRAQRHYWDETAAGFQRGIDRVFPDTTNRVVGASWDGETRLVLTSGPSSAPQYYLFDQAKQELSPLFSAYRGLDGASLAEVRALSFAARDGLPLTAYLTRPGSGGKGGWPTIVLVHDNRTREPQRDWLRFDPLAQFFADRGFAVLQVNYRGSGGFGAAFEKAGQSEWGLGIQTDLEDAVLHAAAKGWVDPARVGIFGHGFGGYSALAGVVRNPGFYRAAGAYGAPTDLATLRRDGQADWGELAEDGSASGAWDDRKRVSATSPYDHLAEIEAPILLGHGALDARVHIKHSTRFQQEMELAGKSCVLYRFEDEHARITRDDHRAIFYQQVADFFRAQLARAEAPPTSE
jgi:dipeptidyl aminopeptidase/acylaminoacyl peptidase